MSILDHFTEVIGDDPGNCVLVVGSGLSKQGVRAGGRGLPDWDELTRLMVDYLAEQKRCPDSLVAQLRGWQAEDPPKYLEIADAFRDAHTHDLDGYERFLRRHLRPDDLADSELHRLILDIGFQGIVSYNFDLVFERQSDRLDKIVYPDLLDQVAHFRRKGYFAKIHGCIDRPATQLVLTGRSFRDLSLSPNYNRLFEAIFLTRWVLCVGFSLRDPNFQSILADLKERFDKQLPPLMALMREPVQPAFADWLSKGVDILPYADHGDVNIFFKQLATRFEARRTRPRNTSSAMPSAPDVQARELQQFIEKWQGAQKIAEMNRRMSQHLASLRSVTERETWLLRVVALCRLRDRLHLCHHLIAVGSTICLDLARRSLSTAAQEDELRTLSPDRVHLPVHQFILADQLWQSEQHDGIENALKWLLDAEWAKHGVDLMVTFRHILSCIQNSSRDRNFASLYVVTEHIPGAAAEIEKIVLPAGFPRRNDRAESLRDNRMVEKIKEEKLRRLFFPHPRQLSPAKMLSEALALEDPEDEYCPCVRLAARFLLTDFVHRASLGLRHSSSVYDPAKSKEIVDALASLRSPKQQITVLWAINHWAEDHRGLGSLEMDSESLRVGLLIPLWWRYSSETRIQFLAENNRHRGMHPIPQWTGQEFLLREMIGLRYDVDEDFRKEFNRSLDCYFDARHDEERYVPFQLQGLWRERELGYEIADSAPPELARRIVRGRADPEGPQQADKQWEEADRAALALLDRSDDLRNIVSADRGDYVIDNLLGAYFPARRRVVLYSRMLSLAASDLGVDCDALSTVVYIHATVHAFAHLGRDLDDRMWIGCVGPESQVPEYQATRAMEGIAQFYTYKLLEWLDDKRLLDAFRKLEEHSDPLYREWRKTADYSFEAMRAVLIRLRDAENEWPPA